MIRTLRGATAFPYVFDDFNLIGEVADFVRYFKMMRKLMRFGFLNKCSITSERRSHGFAIFQSYSAEREPINLGTNCRWLKAELEWTAFGAGGGKWTRFKTR